MTADLYGAVSMLAIVLIVLALAHWVTNRKGPTL